ncbi:MAG: Trm112 family protein [Chloroflexi bacterium]|nr:Trm112 family protein [Chloroflexota bacterium]MCY3939091.1 Trm112 family protein [Chloroflexota bacterium]
MSESDESVEPISPELMEILVCPKSHGPLEQRGNWLYCEKSQLRYPIQDGIPIMLIDEAEPIPENERAGGPVE